LARRPATPSAAPPTTAPTALRTILPRRESCDDDPLAEAPEAPRDPVVRRADAPEGRLAPEDRLARVDRLFPADRLPPDDRLAAAEPLDPEDRLAPEDRVAPDDPLPPEDAPPFDAPLPPAAFLGRVDLFAVEPAVRLALARDAVAGLDEPEPPLLALVPGVVRPVCFRAFLVVATSSPFQDHSGATPWSRTDNRCKANPASASRGSHKSRLSSDPGGEVHLRRVAPAVALRRRPIAF
jgi:hypothetical protein